MKNPKMNRKSLQKANMHAKKTLVFGDPWIWAYAFLYTLSLQPYLYLCISSLLLKRTYVLDLSTKHFSNINKTEMGCQYKCDLTRDFVTEHKLLWTMKKYLKRYSHIVNRTQNCGCEINYLNDVILFYFNYLSTDQECH